MSKLNYLLSAMILGAVTAGAYPAFKLWKHSHKETHSHTPLSSEDENTKLWGKARAPVLTRIVSLENDGTEFVLEGQINTQYQTIAIEWKLPEGVELLEGSLKDQIQRSGNSLIKHVLRVRKTQTELEFSNVLMRAYDPQSEIGSNAIYNLRPDPKEKEMIETVREHMKARNNTFIK